MNSCNIGIHRNRILRFQIKCHGTVHLVLRHEGTNPNRTYHLKPHLQYNLFTKAEVAEVEEVEAVAVVEELNPHHNHQTTLASIYIR